MAAKSKMTEQETAMMKLVTIEEIQEAAKRPSREETAEATKESPRRATAVPSPG